MSGIFLYKKNTKIIVNKTCVTYVMVKAILRTKRIIFYVIKNPTQNTNGPILLNAWGFDHLVSDKTKSTKNRTMFGKYTK